jgi:SAM-dependent methyltransferase
VLARWSGWGAVPGVFDEARAEWAGAREELAGLLSAPEMAAAARNTLNAHYTDADIVQAIWDAVAGLGFTGGQVLEAGCGSGNFIGFAPDTAQITGVELDPVTAGIAAALYPGARIVRESFADTRVPDGYFDLSIGNVPFAPGRGARLADSRHNPGRRHSIHNHFILKELHLTRPGGLVVVLTSRYTLDSQNPAARREMAALADLVGAVRLPSGSQQRAAGTSVVMDLLIFRRRGAGQDPPDEPPGWEQTRDAELDGHQVPVNGWFLDHPEMVLGQLRAVHSAYRAGDLSVQGAGDTAAALRQALAQVTRDAAARGLTWTPASGIRPAAELPGADDASRPDGYLRARPDGTFSQLADGAEIPFKVPATQAAELRHLLALRDMVLDLLDAEAGSPDDTEEMAGLRRRLNDRYDSYVRSYGPVSRFKWRPTGRTDPETGEERRARIRPPQGGFRTDPFSPAVLALEHFDPVSQVAGKAAIFTGRVVAPRSPRLGADDPADALAICVDLCGEVRLDAIARLLGKTEDEARAELGTLIFETPPDPEWDRDFTMRHAAADIAGISGFDVTAADIPGHQPLALPGPPPGTLVPAAEYLSGDVRRKLSVAEAAAHDNPRFTVNADALRQVLPADLGPGEIIAKLGAAWIGAGDVQQFLREILDDDSVQVEHPGGSVWGCWPPRPGAPGGTRHRSWPRPCSSSAGSRSVTWSRPTAASAAS